ncbi:MAG TPA: twin-arginine translocase TatA/TatE family subunit [Candidatus Dormibacteraeota bacterium]|nr:twin-arginine translocase TatA/TatE family subunit [Candidatus Dormibacteraeota bacterium]
MLSIPHMIVVFIVVLVVFGPNKLPELARGFGKLMAEFRKASGDFKSAFEQEMREIERQAAVVERKKAADAAAAAAAAAPVQPATQATPAGTETAVAATPAEDTRATEAQVSDVPAPGLVVTPVPEAIARETAAYTAVDASTPNSNGSQSPEATPEPIGERTSDRTLTHDAQH